MLRMPRNISSFHLRISEAKIILCDTCGTLFYDLLNNMILTPGEALYPNSAATQGGVTQKRLKESRLDAGSVVKNYFTTAANNKTRNLYHVKYSHIILTSQYNT